MADDFYMQYAAHVGHEVTHQSTSGRLTLGTAGLLLGVCIAIIALPESVTVVVVLEAASTAGIGLADGKIAGGLIDSFVGAAPAGNLISGIGSVFLGPTIKQAARVNPDTVASCDGANPAEGSVNVMLGPEVAPMSRRGDRLTCGGTISQGLASVVVGGQPSQKGTPIDEKDPALLKGLTVLSDALNLPKEGTWKLALGLVQLGADIVGDDRLAKLAGVPTMKPANVFEGIKAVSDAKDTAGALLPSGSPDAK
jgi:hypothetical protein